MVRELAVELRKYLAILNEDLSASQGRTEERALVVGESFANLPSRAKIQHLRFRELRHTFVRILVHDERR